MKNIITAEQIEKNRKKLKMVVDNTKFENVTVRPEIFAASAKKRIKMVVLDNG